MTVTGSYRAKGLPKGRLGGRLGRRQAVWRFYAWQYSDRAMKAGNLSESGRIRPHLTLLECGIMFGGILAGAISRKGGLIWGIPARMAQLFRHGFDASTVGEHQRSHTMAEAV